MLAFGRARAAHARSENNARYHTKKKEQVNAARREKYKERTKSGAKSSPKL